MNSATPLVPCSAKTQPGGHCCPLIALWPPTACFLLGSSEVSGASQASEYTVTFHPPFTKLVLIFPELPNSWPMYYQ